MFATNDVLVGWVNDQLKKINYQELLDKIRNFSDENPSFFNVNDLRFNQDFVIIPGNSDGRCCENVYVFTEHSYKSDFAMDKIFKVLGQYFLSCQKIIKNITIFVPIQAIYRLQKEGGGILSQIKKAKIKIDIFGVDDAFTEIIHLPYKRS